MEREERIHEAVQLDRQGGAGGVTRHGPRIGIGVLAGERPGPSPVADAEGVRGKVLVDIDGRPMLARVLDVAATAVDRRPVHVCGPEQQLRAAAPELERRSASGELAWVTPGASPSRAARAIVEASLAAGADAVVVTTGDHPLLTPSTLGAFIEAALATDADAVAGLASHAAVRAAFPDSRRTALKFADEARCGCNLFLFRGRAALPVLDFWQTVESHRKQPHRILGLLGPGLVVRYMAGRLTLGDALRQLSRVAGATVQAVRVEDPDAAVDVDSLEDLMTVRTRWKVRAAEASGRAADQPGAGAGAEAEAEADAATAPLPRGSSNT